MTTHHERDAETGLDYRGARFYDSDVARFLSLDPLAAEFPEWSDYNYVLGNLVMLVDPDGKRIKVGKWYQIGFKLKVHKELRFLSKNSSAANSLIKGLRKNKDITIQINKTSGRNQFRREPKALDSHPSGEPYRDTGNKGRGLSRGGKITYNPDGTNKYGAPQAISLAHELKHADDASKGILNSNRLKPLKGINATNPTYRSSGKGIKLSDYRAVQFQNTVIGQVNASTGSEIKYRSIYNGGSDGTWRDLNLEEKGLHKYSEGEPELPVVDDYENLGNQGHWDKQVERN